jgi:hypothetical protein
MNELAIELRGGVTAYRPGGTIEGTVSWSFDKPPRSVELRLFWYTRGFGTEDAEVVEKQSFDGEQEQGRHSFALRLPAGPYSFHGTLITLVWALELVGPHATLARTEFSMGPEGRPVELMP